MKSIDSIPKIKEEIKSIQDLNQTIGFVPTMGALHEGHLKLVEESKKENDVTVVSIFVNPTQFNDPKDFEKYPSTLKQDIELLTKEEVNLLFLPNYLELYPDSYRYKMSENEFSSVLCGAHRPGHFDGVLTIVMKLLNIIEADRAYFGEKDFQQLSLIKDMVRAFFVNTQIVSVATVREADGLAMSSRNRLLSKEERKTAAIFPQVLSAEGLSNLERKKLLEEAGFRVDYIEDRKGRRFGAVRIGDVRLIDNFRLFEQPLKEISP